MQGALQNVEWVWGYKVPKDNKNKGEQKNLTYIHFLGFLASLELLRCCG